MESFNRMINVLASLALLTGVAASPTALHASCTARLGSLCLAPAELGYTFHEHYYTNDLMGARNIPSGTGPYTLHDTLPAGLSFDAATGAITGTPSVGTFQPMTYIRVSDAAGQESILNLEVCLSNSGGRDCSCTAVTVADPLTTGEFQPQILESSRAGFNSDNDPIITFEHSMSVYQLDPVFRYDQCDAPPTRVNMKYSDADACVALWDVDVRYADDCEFNQNAVGDFVSLSGDVDVTAYELTTFLNEITPRDLSKFLNWIIYAPTTIDLSAVIFNVENACVCSADSDCNGQSCVDNCQCDCAIGPTSGLAGQTCDEDTEPPAFVCPAGGTIEFVGDQPLVSADFAVSVSDNVNSNAELTLTRSIDGVPDTTGLASLVLDFTTALGVTNGQTISISAQDAAGRSATCDFTVVYVDIEDPTVVCPADITSADASIAFTEVSKDDNIAVVSTSASPSSPITTDGEFTVVYTVLDAAGNDGTCQFTVIRDTDLPGLACPADLTVNTDAGEPFHQLATIPQPTHTETVSLPVSTSIAPASIVDNFQFTVPSDQGQSVTSATFTVTDALGNDDTCTWTVTVIDNEDPSITCSDINLNVPFGTSSATATWTLGTDIVAADNVGVDTVGHQTLGTFATTVSGPYDLGSTDVTFTATDFNGNTNTCVSTVTVTQDTDGTDPEITCPANLNVNTDASQRYTTVDLSGISANDNSGSVTIVVRNKNNDVVTGDSTQVDIDSSVETFTATATDAAGNTATCSFTVTVSDAEQPDLTCPSSITISSLPGEPAGYLLVDNQFIYQTNAAGTTDLAGAISNINLATGDNVTPAGSLTATPAALQTLAFTYGTPTTLSITITDAAGNTADCDISVIVRDDEDPVIECEINSSVSQTIETDADQNFATLVLPDQTASDNSPGLQDAIASGKPANDQYPIGSTVITYTATDAMGNSDTCTYTVIVVDAEKPDVACTGVILSTDADQAYATFTATSTSLTLTSSDNSGDAPSCALAAGASNTQWSIGSNDILATCTDAAGNSNTVTCTIVVEDLQNPSPICNNQDLNVPGYSGEVTQAMVEALSSATDNDGLAPTLSYSGLGAFTVPSPNNFGDQKTITITVTAVDNAGNSDTCDVVFTLIDTGAPTPFCPADQTFSPSAGLSSADYGEATYQDNSGFAVVSSENAGPYALGPHTITYTATDAATNADSCSFTITIQDTTDPVITCPADVTLLTSNFAADTSRDPAVSNGGIGGSAAKYTEPTATDNYDFIATASVALTSGPAATGFFGYGATDVTWTATDAAGNTHSCTFTVTVVDDVDPVIADCPASATLQIGPDAATVDYGITLSVSDDLTVMSDITVPSAARTIGAYSFEFDAFDLATNQDSCAWTITVEDNVDPIPSCPSGGTFRSTSPDNSYEYNYSEDYNSSDNVEVASNTFSPAGYSFTGTTIVTMTTTDTSGNTGTCQFTVEVIDAYPQADESAVLDSVDIIRLPGDNYGADLIFRTAINYPWTIDAVNGTQPDLPLGPPDEVDLYRATNCLPSGGQCIQQWTVRVQFDSCAVTSSSHLLNHNALCSHGGCTYSDEAFDITVTITVDDDLCSVTSLTNVTLSASITTLSTADLTDWEADWALDNEVAAPAPTTVFDTTDPVVGLITIDSADMETLLVRVLEAQKTYWTDLSRSNQIAGTPYALATAGAAVANPGGATSTAQAVDHCSITFSNDDLPLDTQYTSELQVTIQVDYRLAQSDSAGRRLLATQSNTPFRRLLKFKGDVPKEGAVHLRRSDTLATYDEGSMNEVVQADVLLGAGRTVGNSNQELAAHIQTIFTLYGELDKFPAGTTYQQYSDAVMSLLTSRLNERSDRFAVTVRSSSNTALDLEVLVWDEVDSSSRTADDVTKDLEDMLDSTMYLTIGATTIPVTSGPYFRVDNDVSVASSDSFPVAIVAAIAGGVALCLVLIAIVLLRRKRQQEPKRVPAVKSMSSTIADNTTSEQVQQPVQQPVQPVHLQQDPPAAVLTEVTLAM